MQHVTPEEVGLCSKRLARIGPWMRGWVDSGRLPGMVTLVARRGRVAYLDSYGLRDVAAGQPMAQDTLFRIYSMTKPLTSVAIMMLYEQGHFQLDDPIARYLPMFADMRVFSDGDVKHYKTVAAKGPITFRHLLTHTSGLTYGFLEATPVDALYRRDGVDFQTAARPLLEMMTPLAALPLLCQPGAEWNYSVGTDVLGALVEVISGQDFGCFMRERILSPLAMHDTDFYVHENNHGRFAANYTRSRDGGLKQIDGARESRYLQARALISGGGGLVSSVADYFRFCLMMRHYGELDGVRLLGRKTVEFMTRNHLRGDMADMGQPRFSESSYSGVGFGLGFSVMLDPAKAEIIGSPGEYAWGGAASTAFWIDPQEDMAVILLTQLLPSSTYPLRRQLRVLSYQAIVA
jgi:CubicO group peptidase (beta-lactamase class C family)